MLLGTEYLTQTMKKHLSLIGHQNDMICAQYVGELQAAKLELEFIAVRYIRSAARLNKG